MDASEASQVFVRKLHHSAAFTESSQGASNVTQDACLVPMKDGAEVVAREVLILDELHGLWEIVVNANRLGTIEMRDP